MKQPTKQTCTVGECRQIALRHVGNRFYCEAHREEAYAEAKRVTNGRTRISIDRGEWLKQNHRLSGTWEVAN